MTEEQHATINREIAEGLGWISRFGNWYLYAVSEVRHVSYPDYINSAEASATLEDELHGRGIDTYCWTSPVAVDFHTCCRKIGYLKQEVPITTSASAARRLALAMCAAKVLKRQEKPNA